MHIRTYLATSRRARLGLAIYGPFSANRRRRRPLREWSYAALTASLVIGLITFLAFLFN